MPPGAVHCSSKSTPQLSLHPLPRAGARLLSETAADHSRPDRLIGHTFDPRLLLNDESKEAVVPCCADHERMVSHLGVLFPVGSACIYQRRPCF